jgi:hypothetical protein
MAAFDNAARRRGPCGGPVIFDGRHWVTRDLPAAAGFDPRLGSSAGGLVVGPEGLIAMAGDGVMSTIEVWWSSVSGRTWSRLAGYPPLGVEGADGSVWFGAPLT